MIRLSTRGILCISISLGIAANVIPPLPALGMLAAALVFPQGAHSNYALAYIALALGINFCVTAGLSYWILKRIFSINAEPKAVPNVPVKGIIYTETEIEEFKRRGLM